MISQVKVIRQRLLLTQVEFSKKLSVSKQMISNYETGQYKPSMKVIKRLIDICRENDIEINTNDFFIESN